jgi:hypothetical protein
MANGLTFLISEHCLMLLTNKSTLVLGALGFHSSHSFGALTTINWNILCTCILYSAMAALAGYYKPALDPLCANDTTRAWGIYGAFCRILFAVWVAL